ncbi:MAG: Na+/H+ antiporter NhaA [Oligoflexia bacterium]|nr:Na+/H+ antiporter NhaA [Oligoflexia bacterium]MBF0365146.1 Na+/H+ antiporter NhaA [Oligoflexia bacterium]
MEFVMLSKIFKQFLQLESSSGILLIVATLMSTVIVNTSAYEWYQSFFNTMIAIKIGNFNIEKPLLLWINDGFMSIFFFLVGLELKREFMIGELKDKKIAMLPLICAIGGMIVPSVIYYLVNRNDAYALTGWAIPMATDIALVLGVLALLGNRVSNSLRIFLLAIAIFDDLGAILIIALFYTSKLSLSSLSIAGAAIMVLSLFNWRRVTSVAPYLLVGLVLWAAFLKSGVHATLSGVVLAFFIPLKSSIKDDISESPLEKLEHDLHPAVAYGILPLFAFANTGISLSGFSLDAFIHPITLGVFLGLFVGKPVGILLFAWIAIKLKFAKLPLEVSVRQVVGISILCGIGLTMSLFISTLAFEHTDSNHFIYDRLGIILGSLFSGLFGFLLLRSK